MTGRRVHERYECDFPATLVVDEEREITGTATNISLGGLFIVTDESLPYGMALKVRFRVTKLKEDALVDVVVRWVKPTGIGVQFGSLRALEVWALNQYFKDLEPSPMPA